MGLIFLYIMKLNFGLLVSIPRICEVFDCYYSLRCQDQNKLAICTYVRILEKLLVPRVSDKAGFYTLVLKCILIQAEGVLCIDCVHMQINLFLHDNNSHGDAGFTHLCVFS